MIMPCHAMPCHAKIQTRTQNCDFNAHFNPHFNPHSHSIVERSNLGAKVPRLGISLFR
ncbi:predicted protein [Botrytis cinerea T4]|uniref:Uncharacterized protein n=1 Tax=Botryotinia fuckeliana (strain T4) TaxID=999810 RepID=G2Y0J3_BOTF4|nr:predicted protein [Botrytis cinerea T4]